MEGAYIIRLKPNQYIHVLDNNTNVTRLLVGPATFTRQDHEKILFQPKNCINVPPRHYCCIKNPVVRDSDGKPSMDANGQNKIRLGDEEYRFEQDPFPLYPGEQIVEDTDGKLISKLKVIEKNCALRLVATRDFSNDEGIQKNAGDEWLFEGPGTYMPRVEVQIVEVIKAQVIKPNEALKLRARVDFTANGVQRTVGEEWLVTASGAYMPHVEEEVVGKVKARVLTEKVALHLEATKTFVDVFGKERKAGQQWLVTIKDASTHMPNVYEKVIGEVPITTLNNRQYCVVHDPVDEHLEPRFGAREVRNGECSFFLHPGESIPEGIEDVVVLAAEEALLLRAIESFEDVQDGKRVKRVPGDKWMFYGPGDYIPPVQVEVLEQRRAMALDENEGVYVRDQKTGQVRSIIGQSYMLSPTEVLWEKELPPIVEELLQLPSGSKHNIKDTASAPSVTRNKTQVVRFSVQHNAAVQIYDYKAREPRIVFGPGVVMLGPDEQFTVISLSGDKPKIPNVIKSLQLFLGPDFMTDIITVETSDHARLSLKLSYNWSFQYDKDKGETWSRLFSVPDFVGDACKAVASRIRGAIAAEVFDSFHRNSARLIRAAVFGMEESGKIRDAFTFSANGLTITNIDIQSVEPVDQKTRDSLQKSVQMAIEIVTKSQEASARHEAERKEQGAKGKLERQVIQDKAQAESARKEYLELQAETEAIESAGTAKAEAKARAEAAQIECESEVAQAKLKAEAMRITAESELKSLQAKQNKELDYQRKLNEMELTKAKELAEIESKKFTETVESIGQDTLLSIAQAGPEMQAKLLEGLGLKGYLITDGSSPINLFNTAKGMVGGL
jgi:major vault protein|uniref:Major vault protein n=1 Tax=Eutreptiella gymnastica TaxID=73025 RepID=A0A6T2BZH3_9EUGL|mmetsp:Transcript_70000/g.116627  ORF Transcript_70000/g.116627 Transcript_70000/m.116627 type:complete len:841 (+) Transcript_70000:36-2558(+)